MKTLKRLLASLLCLVIAFVGLPFVASAEQKSDYTYLSDIYYAYPSYISKSAVLDNYCDDNIEIMYVALDHYLNSDEFEDSEVKTVLINNPSNVKDYIQMFLSGYFGANYVKDDAIDLANELFLQSMFNTNSVEATNVATDFADKVVKLSEVMEEFSDTVEGTELIDSEILRTALSMLQSSGILKRVSSSQISSFLGELIPNLKTASGVASFGEDMIRLGKTLMLAIMLEDVRIDVIKAALDNTTYESTFYTGMKRLYDDMSPNFGRYVYDNYVVNGLLEKLEEVAIDKLAEAVLKGTAAVVELVGLVFEVAGYVRFPNTPDLNQIMLQMVLTDYVSGMQQAVYAFDNKFDSQQFTAKDISTHKQLILSLKTLTDLALQKTKPLAVVQSDLNTIKALQSKYNSNYDLYTNVMNDVRSIISAIPVAERKRAYYNSWIISNRTTTSYGSDTVTDDKLYFTNGVFNGNVGISSSLVIPSDMDVKIEGSLSLSRDYVHLINNGVLTVTGSIIAQESQNYSSARLENTGFLTVGGDFYVWNLSNYENATITVAGDYYEREPKVGEGTIILNGTEQQTIGIQTTKNLYVLNSAGIKYDRSFYITGEYFLNGNPLDNDGDSAIVNSSDVKFDSISDYKKITICEPLTLPHNIKGDIHLQRGNLTIPEGKNVVIDGNISLGSYDGILQADGDLTVTGNCSAQRIVVNGNFTVHGNLMTAGSVTMDKEDSAITVGGNFSVGSSYYNSAVCNITAGTVILNGTAEQEVYNLKCHNLIVTNKAGIKYNSVVFITGDYFLNGNPLDNNGYSTIVTSSQARFDSISDYKEVTLQTGLVLPSNIRANMYINNGTLVIPEGKNVAIDGNISSGSYGGGVQVDGDLTLTGNCAAYSIAVNGNFTVYGNLMTTGYVTMDKVNSAITVGGNFLVGDDYNSASCNITAGTVILNGTAEQEVYNLKCHNLIVTNKAGIKYNSAVFITGEYLLNGNPLDNNGYSTIVTSSQARFDSISDYKEVTLRTGLVLPSNIRANMYINNGTLVIPEGKNVAIDGNISSAYGSLQVDGDLTITGNSDSYYTTVDGNLTVCGNFSTYYISMSELNSTITVGGNWYVVNNYGITNGKVTLNGTALQTVYNICNAPVIILENKSEGGVVFNSTINPTILFNHNGNKFTLYSGGYGSRFADYDGDKVTDEKDDNPTVFSNKNYCETICDITNDGKTNVLDFIGMMKNSVNGSMGDINLDGNIDANDLIYVKKVLLGIFVLPIGA